MRLLAEMTRGEAREASAGSVLLLPLGATEQHGPHLPTGTDSLLAAEVARRAATHLEGAVPIVIAPTLWFGSSAHHVPFGGTLSLDTDTYLRVLTDLGRSAVGSGFSRLFLLNGHGGNHELMQAAARDLALQHPVHVAAGSYWAIAYDALRDVGGKTIETIPGHSGGFETSMMMALSPHLVREPRPARPAEPAPPPPSFRAPLRIERHGSWQAIDGFSDSPASATADAGDAFFEAAVRAVADSLSAFYDASREG